MKILIYGDSNTWGDNFYTNKRIPTSKQWPIILKKKLGRKYQILQEGLPGRLAGNEEVEKKYKNGMDTFMSTFKTCAPVDIVIISLGTNDFQLKYNKSKDKIIEDLKWYTEQIKLEFEDDSIKYFNKKMPKIYYIMPINFDYDEYLFDENSEKKRNEVIKYFKNNKNYNVIIPEKTTLSDGIHLDYNGHNYIANLVYERITKDE
jgi:lysophospholipase L1-like esterase